MYWYVSKMLKKCELLAANNQLQTRNVAFVAAKVTGGQVWTLRAKLILRKALLNIAWLNKSSFQLNIFGLNEWNVVIET